MAALANQSSGTATARPAGPLNPAAFWLALAGLVVQVLAAAMLFAMLPYFSRYGGMMGFYPSMMGGFYGSGWYGLAGWWIVLGAAAVALGIAGVALMSSDRATRVRRGAGLVLVAAILAFPVMWGFWVGSILMFVGAIMGLVSDQRR